MLNMDKQTFAEYKNLIYRESGIVLQQEKMSLLVNRIQKRIRSLGVSDETEYLKIIESDLSGEELTLLIDAISTNVTYFYREEKHFEILGSILEKSKNKHKYRIWCAAASSGEEPYSIALEALEHANPLARDFKILATDICTKVLRRAVDGIYNEKDLEKIPDNLRTAHFKQYSESQWQVSNDLKSLLTFKQFNLIKFPYPLSGPLDIIFCRNVMIYFDVETRQKIINEFCRLLAVGGYLFVSHSENLLGIQHPLKKFDSSVFRKE